MNRIVLTNENPNDHNFILKNNTIDWSRFNANPVMLYNHGKDKELSNRPIGHWTNLQFDGYNWSAEPEFSQTCPEWIVTLYKEGNLKAASVGGAAFMRNTGKMGFDKEPELYVNEKGYHETAYFLMYEASIVPIPSNAEAIQLNSIHTYVAEEILSEAELLTLNTKVKMAKKEEVEEQKQPEVAENLEKGNEETKEIELETSKKPAPQPIILESKKFNVIEKLTGFFDSLLNSEIVEEKKIEVVNENLQVELAVNENLQKEELECKKEEYIETKAAEEIPEVVKKELETEKTTPEMKTEKEMNEEVQLAAKPQHQAKVGDANVPSFTELRSKEDGLKIINKVTNRQSEALDFESHKIVLNSILKDHRLNSSKNLEGKSLIDLITFSDKSGNRSIPKQSVKNIAYSLESGNVDFMNFRSGKLQNYAELGASDDLITSPDLVSVEWLTMFVNQLFPSGTWKSEIPTFSATQSTKNVGLIIANIAANPTIYKGARPSNPALYEYDDLAVSLRMTPFYMNPMLWEPLKMARLNHDQQGTGWASALNKMMSEVDDYLIYNIAATIGSLASPTIVKSTGTSFSIAGSTDINSFILNDVFIGNLAKPTLNDVLKVEQIFKKQNFGEGTKYVVLVDPTADNFITSDEGTKSLLTRFVNSEGTELVSFKNAKFRTRSKVALVNPAADYGVIDPSGVVPATSISSGLAFVPDQVGIGIGEVNVFMEQNTTKYGYEMSANMTAGSTILRKNGHGTALFTYGEPQV